MAIVRTLRPDETDAVADLTARVFSEPGEYDAMFELMQSAYANCPFISPELCWVAEAGERIVAKWLLLDFQMRIAGTPIRMAGIQAVAAEPDENHKGYAKEVALAALPQVRELEFDLVMGFAQRGAFYRRLGGVVVAADYRLELDSSGVPPLRDDPFREWNEAEDLPAVIEMYNRSNAHATGPLIRDAALWPWLVRRPQSIYLCDEGYVGVTLFSDRLEIREVAGQGPAFHDAAIRKVAALARQAGIQKIRGAVAPDHPLIAMASAYGLQIRSIYTHKSGCLGMALAPVRLIGRLRETLDARLADSRYGDIQLDLGLRSAGESDRLVLNPKGRHGRKLDLQLPDSALLQLAMGHLSVASLLVAHPNACGEPATPEVLGLLDTVFPSGHPFMWHTDRY
jgi:predicted N-acetyltransferase YhbS